MNHIPPYSFLSREDDDDVRNIGKHDFCSVLRHPMCPNANRNSVFDSYSVDGKKRCENASVDAEQPMRFRTDEKGTREERISGDKLQ